MSQSLELRKPRVSRDDFATAHRQAIESSEPVLVPVSYFADDRGWSLMNLMQGVLSERGQINFSTQYPGVIKAWHRHSKQTDFWLCLRGNLKVGVWRDGADFAWLSVIGEKAPGVLIIPPPLWHGATAVGPDPAGLLYYVTHAYDPAQPDEDRRPHDSVPGFPWSVRHG